MLLIVAHHYVVNSGLSDVIFSAPTSGRSLFLLLFGAWGKTGINCFVLITGYFMCKSQITLKKFLKLLLELEFYKIVFYLIFLLTGYEPFAVTGLAKAILPILSIGDGFTSCYLIFFLCIPFLNVLVGHMAEKQHILLIFLTLFTYTLIGTLPKFGVTMNYVSWFIVLYLISSYIRLYPKKIFQKTTLWGILAAGTFLIAALSVFCMTFLAAHFGKEGFRYPYWFVSDSNKVLALAVSLSAFLFFKNVKIRYSRFINGVAASAFGVLLIHANSDTMRRWLWKDTLNNVGMYGSPYLALHAIGSVIAIYGICTAIDSLRIWLLEKPFFRLWDSRWEKIQTRCRGIEGKICKKFHIQEE